MEFLLASGPVIFPPYIRVSKLHPLFGCRCLYLSESTAGWSHSGDSARVGGYPGEPLPTERGGGVGGGGGGHY